MIRKNGQYDDFCSQKPKTEVFLCQLQSILPPYDLDGRIPLRQAIPLGLQHVLAMFVGNLSPLLIIMGACSITAGAGLGDLWVSLLQNAMFIAGVVTLLQLYPIGPIGGKLPIVMGTSSGFIGINNGIAAATLAGIAAGTITTDMAAGVYTYGVIMGASLIGGAAVFMFASIVVSGINLITRDSLSGRNATIVAIALGLGYGIGSTAAVQNFMPQWLKYIFGGSGIVPAALIAILLNIILPKEEKQVK